MSLILTIDQSTSASKALLFDTKGNMLDRESVEHCQHYPHPGWVEHDAEEIWQNVLCATGNLLNRNKEHIKQLIGVSITNQRETIVIFDRESGQPLYPAIVWQCRRSDEICNQHNAAGDDELIHACTGLRLDAYFSGSKLQWLIENKPELKAKLANGTALIGTIDTYLIYRLTRCRVFATDPTNASRTLLYNIKSLQWDKNLCSLWKIPLNALAEVKESSAHFGETNFNGLLNHLLPIVGVMGDSQAALFAQKCFTPGMAKVTFGTGSSVLLNIGTKAKLSTQGVVTALAWIHQGEPTYAFEGIIINSAATLNWLQNQLKLVSDVAEITELANDVPDSAGVYLVPAFSGLGLPHWQPNARAAIVGLSSHSDRRHILRAALDSMTYQLRDALDAMQTESGVSLQQLKADGAPTANTMLMQFTADITETELMVSKTADCSPLGAAMMGLLGLGIYSSLDELAKLEHYDLCYVTKMPTTEINNKLAGWQGAMRQVLSGVLPPLRTL